MEKKDLPNNERINEFVWSLSDEACDEVYGVINNYLSDKYGYLYLVQDYKVDVVIRDIKWEVD